ncbi:mediator of RNA polymerase II transcription subunit 26-like isoform X6 [Schistocerca cancellata]|uniref:mediator of RNA polymerase II transcription subunit 26-like isoform X6 n=1 Tax=Schistocerca cancellata TaxID=274614 RepID=UPI00211796B5|nr:mediator of RNA polymerase II transcription subunit 26-like isoform X6 [Schistocerca cancellata]
MQHSPSEIKEKLLRALDKEYNVINYGAVEEVIGLLENTPVTKEVLETTRLGRYINELRKKTTDEMLAKRAKGLVRQWRHMIMPERQSPAHRVNGASVGASACASAGASPVQSGPTPGHGASPGPHSPAGSPGRPPHHADSVPRTIAANKRLRKDDSDEGQPPAKVARQVNGGLETDNPIESVPAVKGSATTGRRRRAHRSTNCHNDDIVKKKLASAARALRVKTTQELLAGLSSCTSSGSYTPSSTTPEPKPVSPALHARASPAIRQPSSPASRQPVSPAVRQPVSPAVRQPVSPAVRQPVSPAVRQPVSPAVRQPVSPAVRQPVSPAVRQPVSPAVRQPVSPAVRQPVSPAVRQPVSPAVRQPVSPALRQPLSPAVVTPVSLVVRKPVSPVVRKPLSPVVRPHQLQVHSNTAGVPPHEPVSRTLCTSPAPSVPTPSPTPPLRDDVGTAVISMPSVKTASTHLSSVKRVRQSRIDASSVPAAQTVKPPPPAPSPTPSPSLSPARSVSSLLNAVSDSTRSGDICAQIAEIMSRLPPIDASAVCREETSPSVHCDYRAEDLLDGEIDGVTGNVSHDGKFREWHECVSRTTAAGELLHILPYTIID